MRICNEERCGECSNLNSRLFATQKLKAHQKGQQSIAKHKPFAFDVDPFRSGMILEPNRKKLNEHKNCRQRPEMSVAVVSRILTIKSINIANKMCDKHATECVNFSNRRLDIWWRG